MQAPALWRSLRFRITTAVLLLFVVALWTLWYAVIQSFRADLVAALPTVEAFAPLDSLHRRITLVTLALTVAVSLLCWIYLGRRLQPLATVVDELARMKRSGARLSMPERVDDEVGTVVVAVNQMLEVLSRQAQTLDENRDLIRENHAILNNASVGILRLKQRVVVSSNACFERLNGFAPGQSIGVPTRSFFVDQAAYEAFGERAYRAMASASEYAEEIVMKRRDGTTYWAAVTGTALDRTDPTQDSIWTIIDVSERVRSQQEVRRLLQAIEQSPVSIVITDRDGLIEYVNPRFTEVTGYSAREAIGENPRILQSGTTPLGVYEGLWTTLLAGKLWQGTLQNRRKSGELFWEFARIAPILEADATVSGFIAVKEDITESKLIKKELAIHQQHLEKLVQKRTVELSDALVAAHQADQAKDAFLATISHELRTPLSAVLGLSELARNRCHDVQQQGYLDKINSAGKTLRHLIDDLLDLSKIVAGRMEFEEVAFDPRQLTERCQSIMAVSARQKGLELKVAIDAGVPELLVGDPLRIEQILFNLLSNAIKFTGVGWIDLHVGTFAHEADRVGLSIEVIDTGIGMTDEEMRRLFKPFGQADVSMSRRYGGSGLGLAISRHLSHMMAGEIEVSSAKGLGSTFSVKLWLRRGRPEDLPCNDTASAQLVLPQCYHDASVLLVEDQPVNQEIVEALLTQVGITPVKANNGREAVDILVAKGAEAFDLVLMDVQMPILDGLSATRELRARPGFGGLCIVAMTAHTMQHEIENCYACGMNDHLGKPFDTAAFYAALARWISIAKQCFSSPVPTPAESLPAETPPLQVDTGIAGIAGLDVELAIARFGGKADRYRHWLQVFLTEGPAAMASIRRAVDEGRYEEARKAAHALKGRVGMLGMTALHPLASALEIALGERENVAEALFGVDDALQMLCIRLYDALGAEAAVMPSASGAGAEARRR